MAGSRVMIMLGVIISWQKILLWLKGKPSFPVPLPLSDLQSPD